MKSLFTMLLVCVSFIRPTILFAQYNSGQNKVWAFGHHAGLDFNSGVPVPVYTSMNTIEGCASICDKFGRLLFYSDGKTVYNRTGGIMPSGNSVVPFNTFSTTQGAVIVPTINNPNQYFLFSLEEKRVRPACRLAYSIVDMTLDSGMGDVMYSSSGIIIKNELSEKMIAITGNNNNVWLITHSRDSAIFYAFEITNSGISNLPVISKVGELSGIDFFSQGIMKASPNRRKIVSQCTQNSFGTELFDFNPSTGIVSNSVVLDSGVNQYGAEFSPDSKKLYTNYFNTTTGKGIILQFDISLTTIMGIKSSKVTIFDSLYYCSDLKLAPDNKIYINNPRHNNTTCFAYLDCISVPNAVGSSCRYLYRNVFIPDACVVMGFPNVIVTKDTMNKSDISEINIDKDYIVYPNPATDHLTIDNPNNGYNSYIIYTLLGQAVLSGSLACGKQDIAVRNLASGTYCVSFISESSVGVNRFFVKQ